MTPSNYLPSTDFCSNSMERPLGSLNKSSLVSFFSHMPNYVDKELVLVFCSLCTPSDGHIPSKTLNLGTMLNSGDSSIYSSITL